MFMIVYASYTYIYTCVRTCTYLSTDVGWTKDKEDI